MVEEEDSVLRDIYHTRIGRTTCTEAEAEDGQTEATTHMGEAETS